MPFLLSRQGLSYHVTLGHRSVVRQPFVYWFIWFIILISLSACQSIPSQPHLPKSQQLTWQSTHSAPATHSLLTRISKKSSAHLPTLSGYYPIIASSDAFASRSLLTSMATHSIDIQYYIWHNDTTGQLMLKQLYQAANRGVKVRLLLDDLNTDPKLDQLLWQFAQHPNVAVRLMNPKRVRAITAANFVAGLPYYHRRMHNKTMNFDHELAIIGGRNIGDEYLRNDLPDAFADLDVLLAGRVVNDVQSSFETYWASPLAVDIEALVKPTAQTPASTDFISALSLLQNTELTKLISQDNKSGTLIKDALIDDAISKGNVVFRWVPIQFVADNPAKLTNRDDKDTRVVRQLREIIGTPQSRLSIISSYFVPTRVGIQELTKLSQEGVKVALLTNSFDSTDVPIVHSGYSETRRALLKAGIGLYELKSNADPDFRKRRRSLARNEISTSLHTKAFAVDNKLVFIGSYNVDPRSANLNTELGVVIYDPMLANAFHRAFDKDMLNISYRLGLDANGHMTWDTRLQDLDKALSTAHREPNISRLNSGWVKLFSTLPIEWLL